MLAPLTPLDQLQARLDESIGQLPTGAAAGYASLILDLPEAVVLPPELECAAFGLSRGQEGDLHAGYGVAGEWLAAGEGRLGLLRSHAHGLARQWFQLDPDDTGFRGFAFLGFAASPAPCRSGDVGLPNALLWLPEVALRRHRGQAALVLTTALPVEPEGLRQRWRHWLSQLVPALAAPLPEPLTPSPLRTLRSRPDLPEWRALVEAALTEIRAGRLDKAVLCRRVGLQGRRPFDPERLAAALTYLFPSCQVIGLSRGGRRFVAATPERLLRVQGRRVEVDALAGTAARSASAGQDAALTAALLSSDKNRREHAMVLEAVRGALGEGCDRVEVPPAPVVMQLHNAQHLWSPVSGQLRDGVDLFDLAERLHPTPATNGTPREAARDWLCRVEPLERGWYTGAAGLLEPDGDGHLNGELWVLLRYAEIAGDQARLYAGAGIVAGSDPLAEWRETGHKLAAIASALQFA